MWQHPPSTSVGFWGTPEHPLDPTGLYSTAATLWRSLEPEPLRDLSVEAGTLVLFPSWLEHSVPPHRGQKPRITISFNIAAYWRKDAGRGPLQRYPKVWENGRSLHSGQNVTRTRHVLMPSVVVTRHSGLKVRHRVKHHGTPSGNLFEGCPWNTYLKCT